MITKKQVPEAVSSYFRSIGSAGGRKQTAAQAIARAKNLEGKRPGWPKGLKRGPRKKKLPKPTRKL